MLPLAPNAASRSPLHSSITAVRIIEIIICSEKQPPSIFSAVVWSPLPIAIEALGAPPELISAANAEIIIISGRQTPTPVSARLPSPGIWPM